MGILSFFTIVLFALTFSLGSARWKHAGKAAGKTEKRAGGQTNSIVMYSPCDDTRSANFAVSMELSDNNQAEVRFSGTTRQYPAGIIPQNGIRSAKITSSSKRLCFHSLVVGITIFIDMPTVFKTSCADHPENSFPLCKELGGVLKPVPVCPQAVTSLLEKNGIISTEPPPPLANREEFALPVYDIQGDMAQASIAITEGIREGARKFISRTRKSGHINLGKFSSFLKGVGPTLNALGGFASILATYLTPNPFDELAKYLKKEFDALHRHLNQMEENIADIITSEAAMTRMTDKLDGIRYSTREYEELVKTLAQKKVCDVRTLLNSSSADEFLNRYESRDTDHKLLDLLEVEQARVLGTRSLLNPFMRTNCKNHPNKVKAFMRGISSYAFQGTRALLTYKSLKCLKKEATDCESITVDTLGNDFARKLYHLFLKTEGLQKAVGNKPNGPMEGLEMELRAKYFELVRDKGYDEAAQDSKFFRKVKNMFFSKVFSTSDWPEKCILGLKNDLVLGAIVQTRSSRDSYSSNIPPWISLSKANSENIQFKNAGMKLHIPKKYNALENNQLPLSTYIGKTPSDTDIFPLMIRCSDVETNRPITPCIGRADHFTLTAGTPGYPNPENQQKGRLIFLEFNELHVESNEARFHLKLHSNVDIYLMTKENKGVKRPTPAPYMFGCWSGYNGMERYYCPDDSDRPKNAKERYFAIVQKNDAHMK